MSYIRITPPDKVCHEVFNIVDSPLYNGYQRGLALMFYRFFEEKSKGSAVIIYRQNEIIFFLMGSLLFSLSVYTSNLQHLTSLKRAFYRVKSLSLCLTAEDQCVYVLLLIKDF